MQPLHPLQLARVFLYWVGLLPSLLSLLEFSNISKSVAQLETNPDRSAVALFSISLIAFFLDETLCQIKVAHLRTVGSGQDRYESLSLVLSSLLYMLWFRAHTQYYGVLLLST